MCQDSGKKGERECQQEGQEGGGRSIKRQKRKYMGSVRSGDRKREASAGWTGEGEQHQEVSRRNKKQRCVRRRDRE